jgi:uncharacterized membrane protein
MEAFDAARKVARDLRVAQEQERIQREHAQAIADKAAADQKWWDEFGALFWGFLVTVLLVCVIGVLAVILMVIFMPWIISMPCLFVLGYQLYVRFS